MFGYYVQKTSFTPIERYVGQSTISFIRDVAYEIGSCKKIVDECKYYTMINLVKRPTHLICPTVNDKKYLFFVVEKKSFVFIVEKNFFVELRSFPSDFFSNGLILVLNGTMIQNTATLTFYSVTKFTLGDQQLLLRTRK